MLVVGTDEYYTSQVCHACLQRSIPKNSHDVVHCKNPQCHVTHSRDINSAKNIYLIGRHYLLSGRRHSSFCPLKDAASNDSTQEEQHKNSPYANSLVFSLCFYIVVTPMPGKPQSGSDQAVQIMKKS
jgi:hypothetical protein